MTSWWPLGYLFVTSWWPLVDLLVTSWWPLGDHLLTTWFTVWFTVRLGWFLFSKISEFLIVHVPKLFPLLHRFQNYFCFCSRTFPSHEGPIRGPIWVPKVSFWGFGGGLVYKSGLRILIRAPEVPFLVPPKWSKRGHFIIYTLVKTALALVGF